MQRIICPKCQAEVDSNASVCPKCGAVLSKVDGGGISLTNSYPSSNEKPNQVNQQHIAQAILNEDKKQTNPKTALAVGVVFVVVVLAVLILVIFFGSNDSNNGTTSTTTISSAVESSLINESSTTESSDAAVTSTKESSEPSIEESSEPSITESSEPSLEESSTATDAKTITVEKPDDWGDIYCYIYTKGDNMIENTKWPGEELIESNGKYEYKLPENFGNEECYVIFSTTKRANGSAISIQYPYSGHDGFVLSEKSDFTIADFEKYAEDFKSKNN